MPVGQPVWCYQMYRGSQTGVSSVSLNTLPLWWVELPHIYWAVFQDTGVICWCQGSQQRCPVTGGLQLYRWKQLPVKITLGIGSWWLDLCMAAINCPNNDSEWGTSSQVTKSSPHFFQLVTSREADCLPQDPDDCPAFPMHNVVNCGPQDVKGSGDNRCSMSQPVDKYKHFNVLSPAIATSK